MEWAKKINRGVTEGRMMFEEKVWKKSSREALRKPVSGGDADVYVTCVLRIHNKIKSESWGRRVFWLSLNAFSKLKRVCGPFDGL